MSDYGLRRVHNVISHLTLVDDAEDVRDEHVLAHFNTDQYEVVVYVRPVNIEARYVVCWGDYVANVWQKTFTEPSTALLYLAALQRCDEDYVRTDGDTWMFIVTNDNVKFNDIATTVFNQLTEEVK